ncbi:hypothetical protein AKJ45_00565, partial [candidate division MSBL1 archaeon SCGC-AAA261F19]
MLGIEVIRKEPEVVRNDLKKRGEEGKLPWVDEIKNKDKKWRDLKQTIDRLRHERNELSKKIGEM